MNREHIEIKIEDLGMNGEGIGRANGKTFFVPFALPGELVEAEILSQKKNMVFARAVCVSEPAVGREQPRCPAFGRCGGCQLQHMRYGMQLSAKAKLVETCFRKIAGMTVSVAAPGNSPQIYRYRNKLQLPVGQGADGPVFGFFEDASHRIVPISDCVLHPEWNAALIRIVGSFMRRRGIVGYDERTHSGTVRHLVAREVQGRLNVVLVVNARKLPYADELGQDLLREFHSASLWVNSNRECTNVILGREFTLICGDRSVYGESMGIRYSVHPNSFVQVNDAVRDKIYAKVAELAGEHPDGCIIDAYSGAGLLTAILSRQCRRVYGIEIVPQAVEDADRLCRENGICNMQNFTGDCAELLPPLMARLRGDVTEKLPSILSGVAAGDFRDKPVTVVLDPPRKGCDPKVLRALLLARPERIVYVSCNPATLARDIGILKGTVPLDSRPNNAPDYQIEYLKPYDLFPQTKHVETVVLLSRKKAKDYLEVNVEMDDDFLTKAESKGTYDQIKQYILDKHQIKVSSLYIAQVKEMCGIKERENYNHSKKEDSKQPQVPEDKRQIIMEALQYFKMI